MVKLTSPTIVLGAGIGILADRLLGDPPNRFDPFVAYERVVAGVGAGGKLAARRGAPTVPEAVAAAAAEAEAEAEEDAARAKARGIALAATGTALGAASGWGLRRLTGPFGAACIGAWSSIRGRSRAMRSLRVAAALAAGDYATARAELPPMVHVEAAKTADDALAALAVSTVAEETIDGIVAPALWVAVAGAMGGLAYRGINGLDSLIGHHAAGYERAGVLGRAVDVAANLVPAVKAAALVVIVRPAAARSVWVAVRRDARRHPSWSVGVVESAFGAALGVSLADGSPGRQADAGDVVAAVRLSRDVSLALAGVLVTVGGLATIATLRRAATSVSGRGR